MKILVVVDMQNDFIDGSLGTPEAEAIVPKVVEKITKWDGELFFTRDTHYSDYLNTQEGKKLPIEHCIKGTHGHQISQKLLGIKDGTVIDKPTFGSIKLASGISEMLPDINDINNDYNERRMEIELCGLCTGICVLANAVMLKAQFPNATISVDASCCACTTPESHKIALEAMKLQQINVINEA